MAIADTLRTMLSVKKEREGPAISGLEAVGMKDEDLKRIWSERCYPGRFLEGVDAIQFVGGEEMIPEFYRFKNKQRKAAYFRERRIGKGIIVFSSSSLELPHEGRRLTGEEKELVLDLYFSHEISHRNDWRDPYVDTDKRHDLLVAVMRQFENSDHPETPYLENIEGGPGRDATYTKLLEYWAEIGGVYFSEPANMKAAYPKEYGIFDKWVKERDPKFDPEVAKERKLEDMARSVVREAAGEKK